MDLSLLPYELLPHLLESLAFRRQDLYQLCLVSKEFNQIATPMLYAWVRMFGRDLLGVTSLLRELSLSTRNCGYLKKLEIRVYPMPYEVVQRLELQRMAVLVMKQAINLTELIWTRKGALTDSVLEAIVGLPKLKRLEFNAHTDLSPGSWSPELLLKLPPQLTSLSLILPDRKVASILPSLISNQSKSLSSLTILCRESPAISDTVLYHIIPIFSNSSSDTRLTSLALAGCSKLTHAPLLELFKYLPHLRHLALESNGIAPNSYSLFAPHLTNLISLKLTHPGPRHSTLNQFYPSLTELVRHTSRLESLTLYHSGTTGSEDWPVVEKDFVEILVEAVGVRLRKFECSGVLMSVATLEVLASGAKGLRELVVHLGYEKEMERLKIAISSLTSLRTLHILYQRSDIDLKDVETIADSASPNLYQIGLRNRVWTIKRTTFEDFSDQSTKNVDDDLTFTSGGLILLETAEAFGAFRRAAYGAEPSDQLAVWNP